MRGGGGGGEGAPTTSFYSVKLCSMFDRRKLELASYVAVYHILAVHTEMTGSSGREVLDLWNRGANVKQFFQTPK